MKLLTTCSEWKQDEDTYNEYYKRLWINSTDDCMGECVGRIERDSFNNECDYRFIITNFQNLKPFMTQRTEYSIHYKNFNECLIEANEYFNTLP